MGIHLVSGPAGRVTELMATSFAVTVTALTGEPGTTLALETRALGSAADWATRATNPAPAVGAVLTATGLTERESLEWRLAETVGATLHDGTHGIVTPAESIWSTLTATVSAALQGQGLSASAIYVGRQPEANYADVVAVLRTLEERVDRRANNVERVVYPIEVEIRVTVTDDDGGRQKVEIERWQERVRAALHEKHGGDFPGVLGLEEVTVEVASKDERGGRGVDEYQDEVRARAVVRFAAWHQK